MMAEPILDVRDVDLGYGALTVVHGVSLHVDAGELVGLVGGNGSGKSTILRAVSGMIGQKKGEILFDGEPVEGGRNANSPGGAERQASARHSRPRLRAGERTHGS